MKRPEVASAPAYSTIAALRARPLERDLVDVHEHAGLPLGRAACAEQQDERQQREREDRGCMLSSERVTHAQAVGARRIVVALHDTAIEAEEILGVFVGHVVAEELDVVAIAGRVQAQRSG